MFDRISPRYDLLNRVLSFGTDVSWRRRAVQEARLGPGERALDVGSGTGDLSAGLLAVSHPTARVVGIDLAPRMLAISRRRLARHGRRYRAVVGSATSLPLPDACCEQPGSQFTFPTNCGATRQRRSASWARISPFIGARADALT